MLILLIGPPGAGKGTQAQRLIDYLQIPHLSTGEMLRQAKEEGSALGLQAAPFMDNGRLVPDELVVQIVGERLEQPDCQHGCLLDGFPRTPAQAEALDEYLARYDNQIDLVFELRVDEEELVQRLLGRAAKSDQPRPDDSLQAIPLRLKVYREETQPLLDYYRGRGLLHTVDGMGTPDEVFARLCDGVDAVKS